MEEKSVDSADMKIWKKRKLNSDKFGKYGRKIS